MHTTQINEFTFHHNGDFSGNVKLDLPHDAVVNWPSHYEVEIPFLILVELVGQAVKRETMAQIEQESGIDFLGFGDHDHGEEETDD